MSRKWQLHTASLDDEQQRERQMRSSLQNTAGAQSNSVPFLLPQPGRRGEGGRRMQGHFQQGDHRDNEAADADGRKVKHNPLVTVITVVFNGVNSLEKTIQSVIGQSYPNIEYIVIDGGSTDGTIDALRIYEDKLDYWISEPDSGIYDAMNKGIRASRGDFIGIIGAGDWYEQDAVARVVETFSNRNADVVYGDVEMVDAETALSYRRRSRSELMPKTMSSISHPTTFAKRSIYLSRLFDTKVRIAADYDLFLGLYVEGYRFEHSGSVIAHILTGGVSSSFPTQIEVFKVHQKYYGSFYAARQFLPSALRRMFYTGRRAVLKRLLPPAGFALARTWWLRHKHRKNTKREEPQA